MECGLIVNVTQGIMCDFSNVCIYLDCITAIIFINFCLLICFCVIFVSGVAVVTSRSIVYDFLVSIASKQVFDTERR